MSKLKVEIRNFCCYKEKKVIFKSGLTLLNAKSGTGKTTIFNAIFWALYGKMKNVYPLGVKNPSPDFTAVSIKMNGCVIVRTKPPERLRVILGEKEEYEGEEAQEMINRLFGSRNVWVSNSYVQQEERNPLLSASNNEKLEIVKEIIFGRFSKDREPEEYIKKLEIKIDDVDSQIQSHSQIVATLQDLLEGKTFEELEDPTEDNIGDLRRKSEKLSKRFRSLVEKNERVRRSNEAKKQIVELEEKIKSFDLGGVDLRKFVKYMKLKLRKVNPTPEVPKVTGFQISDLEVKIKNMKKGKKICSKYGIEYDAQEIEKAVKEEMELKRKAEEYRNYLAKKKQRKQDELKMKILKTKMKSGETELKCPSCETDLVMRDGALCIYNERSVVAEFQRLKAVLDVEIHEMEDPGTFDSDKVKDLHGVIIYDIDDSSLKEKKDGLERYNQYIKYKEWKEGLKENLIPRFEDILIEDPEEYITKYKVLKSKIDDLNKLITNEEMDNTDLESEIKQTQDLIILKMKYIENEKIKKEVGEMKERICDSERALRSLTKRKQELFKIREIVKEGINKIMEEQMNTFNVMLNDVLDDLYDDINVKIKMFKKIKSRNVYKPQFDLSINLKGCHYDTYHILSPGEKDRVSMALTIAMNKIMGSNIIILDECMSSMDGELRVKAIESIKRHLGDKIVINVCHGMVTGYYDHIKELKV